jgi:small subunit ribosomal protein S16
VAVRIRLLRMGKIRNPQYRIVVADARTKRDGRAIEYLGLYHPKEDPSRIEVNSERVQHWLSVGAQPSEPVIAILNKTGDWQRFKGLPAPTAPLKVAPARVDRKAAYEAEAKAAAGLAEPEAKPRTESPAKASRAARIKAEPTAQAETTAQVETKAEAETNAATGTYAQAEPQAGAVPRAEAQPEAAAKPKVEVDPKAEAAQTTPAATTTAPAEVPEPVQAGGDEAAKAEESTSAGDNA